MSDSLRYNSSSSGTSRRGFTFGDGIKSDSATALVCDDRGVVGFHGTSDDRAEAILSSGFFTPSKNDYDWLGHGVYFWEYAPRRAWQWAKQKYRDRAAVVEATIELDFCLDLTDIGYTSALQLAYDSLREAFIKRNKSLPVNRNKARCLDCLVINYLTTYVLPECDTVRAAFPEGHPIYEGSMLLTQSHIQLVVRNQACIKPGLKLLHMEAMNGSQLESVSP